MEMDPRFHEDNLLHEIFKEQAQRTPDRTAVCDGIRSITYRELDDVTDRLAFWLQEQGCGPDSIVGIYMNKRIEYVISYIAALKANGAYMPIDVAYPSDLIKMVLEDSQPVAVLTDDMYVGNLDPQNGSYEVFSFGGDYKARLAPGAPVRKPGMTASSLAYCVYSSGTTGKPKGICCPHRGAVLSYGWRGANYPYSSEEIEREAANVFFVWEMLRPLLFGQELWVIPDEIIYDVEKLLDFLQTHKITRQLYTPSLLDAVLTSPNVEQKMAPTMKLLILCGEVVTMQLRNKIRKRCPDTRIHNLYSISEAHDVAGSDLTDDSSLDLSRKFCPVGKLLPFAGAVVVDADMQEVKEGENGEILIAGPTLAREYLKKPDVTATRFFMHDGRRVYRSGDAGNALKDGQLEICGRCDSMVKIRGYSIELRAVEVNLRELEDVQDCCVLTSGDAADTEKKLIAYIMTSDPADSDPSRATEMKRKLRGMLKKRLPFYMVPSYYVFMKSMPVHAASGKMDKKQLPTFEQIQESQGDNVDDLPSTEAEIKVATIFQQVLDLSTNQLDTGDGFFDLGGNSLLTNPLLRELSEAFGRKVVLQEVFDHPSIKQLAAALESDPQGDAPVEAVDLLQELDEHCSHFDFSMQIRAFWRHVEVERMFKTTRVLLTGATGFLGAFMLCEIVKTSQSYVYCIVRGSSDADARARLMANLEQYGLLTDELAPMLEQRLGVIMADASKENFGMEEEDYQYLTRHIDCVVHAAAQVNLIYPYQQLAPTNVLGTKYVIDFCQVGKIKALHYVSSNSVFPEESANRRHWDESEDLGEISTSLKTGYAQTKWVAEQLVRYAHSQGLPATIFRCGNISGHSQSGAWNPKDSNLAIMQACLCTGTMPEGDDFSFEMTPVDFVASFIMECASDIRNSTGKTFHLIQPHRLSFRRFADACEMVGYQPLTTVPVEEWLKNVAEKSKAGECKWVDKETLLSICKVGDSFGTENVGSTYPEVDEAGLSHLLSKLSTKWMHLPRIESSATQQGLKDRLVMVCGASNTVVSEVTRRLAAEGAKLLLVCRYPYLAEALQAEIGTESLFLAEEAAFTELSALNNAVSEAEKLFGQRVWGLVNCPELNSEKEVGAEGLVTSWHSTFEASCKSVMNATTAVLPSLTSSAEGKNGGFVINVSAPQAISSSADKPLVAATGFSASKHFLEAWTAGIRAELNPYGVKVANVSPSALQPSAADPVVEARAVADTVHSTLGTQRCLLNA